ncbi:MAG: superoxide dismutase family protein [Aquificae bacterium]|nr:superoxide dismutase family protein [Aquificota bacterium]
MKKLILGVITFTCICFAHELKAEAELINPEGKKIGKAVLVETASGVLIMVNAEGLPPNAELAFHIHEAGRCDPPNFKSAKGHFNPFGMQHGLLNPKGHHAGDMPNVFTNSKGQLRIHIHNTLVTLKKGKKNSLFKEGGTAIVIHRKGDDYKSDPAGNAGPRIACGVIR